MISLNLKKTVILAMGTRGNEAEMENLARIGSGASTTLPTYHEILLPMVCTYIP